MQVMQNAPNVNGAGAPRRRVSKGEQARTEAGLERAVRAGGVDLPLNRTEPRSIEAEQALLGAILVNNRAHERVSGFLEAHHFYDPLHQMIYEAICKLIASGKHADPITLKPYFEN